MINLVDTHNHIHSSFYKLDANQVVDSATEAGVNKMICVGTDVEESKKALKFAGSRENVWASIGLHPHDAKLGKKVYDQLAKLMNEQVVAVGECGLDYYYNYSKKNDQIAALHFQMKLAKKHQLPMIFHVRDAFDAFWPIYDEYEPEGVIHSFTASIDEVENAVSRGLFIGLNGIMTFSKNEKQLIAAKKIPLENLVLETDAPFLTPEPKRGTINEPKHTLQIAKFLSELRGESLEELSLATTNNAEKLFNI